MNCSGMYASVEIFFKKRIFNIRGRGRVINFLCRNCTSKQLKAENLKMFGFILMLREEGGGRENYPSCGHALNLITHVCIQTYKISDLIPFICGAYKLPHLHLVLF